MDLIDLIKQNKEIHATGTGYIDSIKEKIKNTPISDITDEDGNQYVDLVMEGGTVWGLALIGYTYTLEKAGIRFLNLAGTSAGSINAMVLAAIDQLPEGKSEKLLEIFSGMDLKSFVDGGFLAKGLLNDVVEKDDNPLPEILKLLGLRMLDGFGKSHFGVNPGSKFEDWLIETLKSNGIKTTSDLFDKLVNKPLKIREKAKRSYLNASGKEINFNDDEEQYFADNFKTNEIAVIASDITTQSKITFPQMANLYWKYPLDVNPAKFVRASMSIPVVFDPVKIPNLPSGLKDNWSVLTGYGGKLPDPACLVDGGVLSNFPIDVFHCHDRVPLCPTFGAKLGIDRAEPQDISDIFKFIGAVVETARNNSDFTFIFHNEDYKKLITYIDTSQDYTPPPGAKEESKTFSSLDFNMSPEKKAALFALGAAAARDFICGNAEWQEWKQTGQVKPMPPKAIPPFDWEAYKLIRKDLVVSDPPAYRAKKAKIKNASLQRPPIESSE